MELMLVVPTLLQSSYLNPMCRILGHSPWFPISYNPKEVNTFRFLFPFFPHEVLQILHSLKAIENKDDLMQRHGTKSLDFFEHKFL